MPIITADELRAVLGVSESLYDDAYLEQVISRAELTILPLLTAYQSAINSSRVSNGVATFSTVRPNYFGLGQTVLVAGCGDLDDEYTITEVSTDPYTFKVDTAHADRALWAIIPNGTATLDGASADELYATNAAVKSAILVVSVEIFQSVTASGNLTTNENFNPSPFVLGRSLQSRVIGLLSPFLETETMAQ